MPCAVSSAPRQVPFRCLVLAGAAEAISRASCPPPIYRPLIPNLYSLISNVYPCICHRPYAIGYALFCVGSSICPVEIWSSLTLRRISLGHYALRLIMSFLLITRHALLVTVFLPSALSHLPYAIGYTLYAMLHRLRQAPPRCLVLAGAAEAISRASCPPPTFH